MPKIADYLKILTDQEMKDFVLINLVNFLNLRKENCILN